MIKDKKIASLIKKETQKQKDFINLIASENYVSRDVREAMASPFANKYSEGYPGKRYYPGNEFVDEVEELAKKRALELFGLKEQDWHVNVQPHSGSPANLAAYYAVTKFYQTKSSLPTPLLEMIRRLKFFGMRLDQGGHLTHGHKVSLTGDLFNFSHYGVDMHGYIDVKTLEEMAAHERPALIVCGATAYPRIIDFAKFREIADRSEALLMADIAHIAGLVAAGEHPSPFPHCDIVTTTTHKTLRGPRGAMIFARKGKLAYHAQKQKMEELFEFVDRAVFPGTQGGPHNHQTAAIAVALAEAKSAQFKTYAKQVVKNAKALAEELQKHGFELSAGGTDNHLLLLDLRNKNVGGKDAEELLYAGGIIVNRNAIPNDPAPPMKPSGIRLGTPAITTRGATEKEMRIVAELIADIISGKKTPKEAKKEVLKITRKLKNF